ncbi:MAG: hypothetical protein WA484_00080 [Solirubrobacteraceae bacterium]
MVRGVKRSKFVTLPALSCLVVACLSGCGGSEGAAKRSQGRPGAVATAAALAAVGAAARTTLAHPVGLEFRLDGSRALGSSPAPVLGSGEFNPGQGTGSETIDLGEVRHQEPGTEHVVFLPSRVYLQPKSTTGKVLPAGKAWVSATLSGSDSIDTNFPMFALQAEAVNPAFPLSELAGGAVSAVALGHRPLASGQEGIAESYAQAYEVTVDFTRALSASTGPSGAVFAQAIRSELAAGSSGQSGGGGHGPITVWVAHGRVIQLRSSPPGAGVGTATMTMCCFGTPVHTAVPSPSQVVDIGSLTPSGERENNGGGDSDGG